MSKELVDRFFGLGYTEMERISRIFLGNGCGVQLESRSPTKVVLVGGGYSLTVERMSEDNLSVEWEVLEDALLGGRAPKYIGQDVMTQFYEFLRFAEMPQFSGFGHQVLCPHCGELTGLGGGLLLTEAFGGRGTCTFCGNHIWYQFVGRISKDQAGCSDVPSLEVL